MKRIKCIVSILLTFLMLFCSFPVNAFASTDLIDNKTHNYDEITSLPNEYSYGTLVWAEESEVIYINTHPKYTKRNNNKSYVFGAENGGNFSFKITNCSIDKQGNLCDVTIKVSNVKAFSNFTPANNQLGATFGEKLTDTNKCKVTVSVTQNTADYGDLINFGFSTAGASAVFEMTYYLAGTSTKADIDYNCSTFTDIDIATKSYDPASIDNEYLKGNEGIAMPDSSIYYDKSSNGYIVDGVNLPSFCDVGISAPSRKDPGVDTSKPLKMTSCTALQKLDNSKFSMLYSGRQAGIGWVFISPYDYDAPSPTISIDKERVYEGENFNYTISQYVPNNYYADVLNYINGIGGKCTAFMLVDILDENLVVNGDITITNELGENVTSYFDTNIIKNSLAISARSEILKKQEFYAHLYSVNVPCYIRNGTGEFTGIIDNLANSLISNSKGTQNKSTSTVEVALKYDVNIYSSIDNGVTYINNGDDGKTASSSNTINHNSSSSNTAYFKIDDCYEISKVFVDDKEIPIDKLNYKNGIYSYTLNDDNVKENINHNIEVYTVPKNTSVIVNYLDENNEPLSDSITIEGKVFDKYNTEAKTFEGYELVAIPSNAYGEMTEEPIIVNYIYRLKDTSVVVKYMDDEGNPLSEDITIPGKVFDRYTTEAKTFYGYELTAIPNNSEGEMTTDTIVVTYVYTKKDASVTVNYLNEEGESIAKSDTITGKVKDPYSTSAKDVYGYELIATPDNSKGEMTEEPITVNYIYRLKDTSVIVNYLDENNEPLSDSITIEGKVFDKYNTEAKTFEGYELVAIPSNAYGEMTEEPIIVNYIYRLKDTSVVVKYMDDEGNPLSEDITITGKVFDRYTTEPKTFYGYELTATPSNATGEMTEDVIVVTYVYTKKDASVTVNYLNEEGESIAESETITGKVKDPYSTSAKDVYGYELISTPDNSQGEMTEEPITVNYIYRLKDTSVIVNYLDENNEPLSDSITIEGKVFDKYNTEAKTFEGYELVAIPSNANGEMAEEPIIVNYIYRLKDTSVVVRYVDDEGNTLSEEVTITGKVFDEYSTEAKTFYGYELTATPSNATGEMTEDVIVVTYVYTKKDASVTVNYLNEEGESIAESETITGKVKDPYSTSAKDVYGYELISTPDNSQGEMTEEPITVNYIYRLKDTSVIVNYLDENNEPLSDSITIEGKVFDEYKTEAKEFNGYVLTEIPSFATGKMTQEIIEVNYIYRLRDALVVVNYLDEDGNKLSDSINIKGKYFDEYTSEGKEFEGYELIVIPENANGAMTTDVIEVNYIYKVIEAPVDENINNQNNETPYTGDKGNSILFTSLIIGSIMSIGILLKMIIGKRKKDKQ